MATALTCFHWPPLSLETYENTDCDAFAIKFNTDYNTKDLGLDTKMHKAIAILQFKLEGQLIMRHPEFHMESRMLLDKIDFQKKTVCVDGKTYPMKDVDFLRWIRNTPMNSPRKRARSCCVCSRCSCAVKNYRDM